MIDNNPYYNRHSHIFPLTKPISPTTSPSSTIKYIQLTPLTPQDLTNKPLAESLVSLLQDPIIHKNTLVLPNPYTLSDADWFINFCVKETEAQREKGLPPLHYSIREVVGDVHDGKDGNSKIELGRW
ncbi:hypothetical protein HDU76_006834, partial [Blyttiomyces sp. JEL0837]